MYISKWRRSFKKLRITRHSPAYWRVTFDNPPLNLLDPEMIEDLQTLIDQLEAAKELKVVVFDSANPDFYMAHFDLLRANETSTDVGPTGLRSCMTSCSGWPRFLSSALHPFAEGQGVLAQNLWRVWTFVLEAARK